MKAIGFKNQITPRRCLALLAALLFLAFWYAGARSKDTFSLTTTDTEYAADWLEDPDGFTGLAAWGFAAGPLNPGEYTVTFSAETEGSGNYFRVVEPLTETVLAEAELQPGTASTAVQITVEKHTEQLRVELYQTEGPIAVSRCSWESSGAVYTDAIWGLVLLCLLAAAGHFLYARFAAGSRAPLVIYLCALGVSLPFVSDHLPFAHDMYFHLSRIEGIAAALLSGQFPVRVNAAFEYGAGYLNSVMYPELFFYLPGVLCALGASALFACKVLMLCINLMTAVCGWYAGKHFLGERAGCLFAVLYLLNPYRLNDIFVRGALGEAFAMAFFPLAALGIYELIAGDSRRGFFTAVLGISGVFESHILSTLTVVLFGGGWALVHVIRHWRAFFAQRGRLLTLIGAACTTLLLNLWFIVPFLNYSGWDFGIFHDTHTLDANTIFLWEAFRDFYEFAGYEGTGVVSEMPLSIGFVLLFGAVLFLILCFAGGGTLTAEEKKLGGTALGMGAAGVVLSSGIFPWAALLQLAPFAAVFNRYQFAWRFLAPAAVLLTLCAALAAEGFVRRENAWIPAAVLLLALYAAALSCAGYLQKNPVILETKSSGWSTVCSDYTIHGTSWPAEERLTEGGVDISSGTVTQAEKDGVNMTVSFADADASEDTVLQLPLLYTGLQSAALADGTALDLQADENELITVTVPAGITEGTVTVRYHAPLSFRAAELVSLLTAAALAAAALRRKKEADAAC